MDGMIQILLLLGIAVFLVIRLRSVLGTREGFEKPPVTAAPQRDVRRDFEVIEGGPDRDITDHVEDGSPQADALARMKSVEPSFGVSDFVQGARGAYEMIVMSFERGDLDDIKPFLAEELYDAFVDAVAAREDQGLTTEAEFIGVRETRITDVAYDEDLRFAEVTVRFVGELTRVIRDADGTVVDGDPNAVKKQKDSWTFARTMGSDDPNWILVATGA